MLKRGTGLALFACFAGMALAQPVQAQAWIGEIVGEMAAQQAAALQHACRMGRPMAAREVEEARGPTIALMQDYFAAMQSGSAPRASFFDLGRRTRWQFGSDVADQATINRPAEPFAQPGMMLDAVPIAYFRSGMHALTLAQFQVHDAAGALVGTYTGFFSRQQGQWRIRQLTLTPADEYVEPARQFCDQPDDVLRYRVGHFAAVRAAAERAVTNGERAQARALQRAEQAETAAAERPSNSQRQQRATEARRLLQTWDERMQIRRLTLEGVLEGEAQAQADMAAAQREREEGIARLRANRG